MLILYLIFLIILLLYVVQDVVLDLHSQLKISFIDLQATVILLLHPQHRGPFRMRIYERENFGGQMYELSDDCDNIMDRFHMSDCQSCNVMDGHWLMFEQPGFRGRMLYLRPGEYRNLREMGSNITKFSSIRRIMDSC